MVAGRARGVTIGIVFFLAIVAQCRGVACGDEWEFEVRFSESVRREPYSGRVYLFFSQRDDRQPRQAVDWFHPEPVLAKDVDHWQPGETVTFRTGDETLFRFPQDWSAVNLSGKRVQAVARFNPWERKVGTGAGNGFSAAAAVGPDRTIRLEIDAAAAERPFEETEWSQELTVHSARMSRFYEREVVFRAAVNLPASYHRDVARRYPVIFNVPGFGGTHHYGRRTSPTPATNGLGVEFIEVVLDPSCPLGHHVFADSDNNGPWGTALVGEFLPALDAAYRTDPRPQARFLTGHSSGGWSSLWLQVTHPDMFGGTWSTAPDPVDFHDFQRIDLYQRQANMFTDAAGMRRPLARMNGRVALWYDSFNRMEDVLGYGGQLHSFEAVFSGTAPARRRASSAAMIDSPPAPLKSPALLWDRATGSVDPQVAQQWRRYDIRLILEQNWATLGPKLQGKLHVFMGTEDTFYLEGATRRLKGTLQELGSDAVVELIPGKDHFNLLDRAMLQRIEREMAQAYLRYGSGER